MKMIRIGIISYINTLPFLWGINNSDFEDYQIELIKDYPAQCATKLLNNEIDLGIVPVAIIPKLKEYYIISDFCISATEAKSVFLFSADNYKNLQKIYLDYQSLTSINLLKIIAKYFWQVDYNYHFFYNENSLKILSNEGFVLIGDRALRTLGNFAYEYDLSTVWYENTNLPFVFALWIANKKLDKKFISLFNNALSKGIRNIAEVLRNIDKNLYNYDLETYLTKNILYTYDLEKQKSVELFLKYLQKLNNET